MSRTNLLTTLLQHATNHSYCQVFFEVQDSGNIEHTILQISLKPEADETLSDFIERVRNQLIPGDRLEFSVHNSKVNLARIERSSKKSR